MVTWVVSSYQFRKLGRHLLVPGLQRHSDRHWLLLSLLVLPNSLPEQAGTPMNVQAGAAGSLGGCSLESEIRDMSLYSDCSVNSVFKQLSPVRRDGDRDDVSFRAHRKGRWASLW